MQSSVLRVDILRPLSGDLNPFYQYGNEGKDEVFQPAFHVNAWEDAANFSQQVLVEIGIFVMLSRIVIYNFCTIKLAKFCRQQNSEKLFSRNL